MVVRTVDLPPVSLAQARRIADDILIQMCSSVAVARISRADRRRRMTLAQSIIEKIDADPHAALLAPKEWKLIREAMQPIATRNPLLDDDEDAL